jgi:hypothetical protein
MHVCMCVCVCARARVRVCTHTYIPHNACQNLSGHGCDNFRERLGHVNAAVQEGRGRVGLGTVRVQRG